MRFKTILVAALMGAAGQAHAAVFSEITTVPVMSGEFQADFQFGQFDWTLGSPTDVQVSFTGWVQPKVTNTGLAPAAMVTVQPAMNVLFYGPLSEATLYGSSTLLPANVAAAGIAGAQTFAATYMLPLSFLQAPGGVLAGFAELSSANPVSIDSIDQSTYHGQFTLDVTYDPVDEPMSLLVVGSGLVGLLGLRRVGSRVQRCIS